MKKYDYNNFQRNERMKEWKENKYSLASRVYLIICMNCFSYEINNTVLNKVKYIAF